MPWGETSKKNSCSKDLHVPHSQSTVESANFILLANLDHYDHCGRFRGMDARTRRPPNPSEYSGGFEKNLPSWAAFFWMSRSQQALERGEGFERLIGSASYYATKICRHSWHF